MDRDKFMTPEAAREFGIIDEVIESRPAEEDEDEKTEKTDD